MFYQEMKWGTENRIKHPFYTMQRVRFHSEYNKYAYCMYRLILLLWV
ncbi:unnamed protein product [Staurois parvus]|uniref:Uncharacterized protein n=1 Tax=Staurois parvus TaxID=386267 RepID=A0ABN9B5Q8_9NEOB|nr:unnamed protein product [Staurois parvus]